MFDTGSSRGIYLCYAAECPVQTRTMIAGDITDASCGAVAYYDHQSSSNILTINGAQINNVGTALDKFPSSPWEPVRTSVYDRIVALQQQISSGRVQQISRSSHI